MRKKELQAALSISTIADPRNRDPFIKVEDGRVWLAAGSISAIFNDADPNLLFSAPLRILEKATGSEGSVVTGRNTGAEASEIVVTSENCEVRIPSNSTSSYPFTSEYLRGLENKFGEDSFTIPGAVVHESLLQATKDIEQPLPQFRYTQIVYTSLFKETVTTFAFSPERLVRSPTLHTHCKVDQESGIDLFIPRTYVSVLDHLITKDFGTYHLTVDNPQNPTMLKAVFTTLTVYMPLDIEPDQAVGDALSHIQVFLEEDWEEAKTEIYPLPEGWRKALTYSSELGIWEVIVDPRQGEMRLRSTPSSPVSVDQTLPFHGKTLLPFKLAPRRASSSPGEFFFLYATKDGVRQIIFFTDIADISKSSVHFVNVSPYSINSESSAKEHVQVSGAGEIDGPGTHDLPGMDLEEVD